jgi:hypothetical protein
LSVEAIWPNELRTAALAIVACTFDYSHPIAPERDQFGADQVRDQALRARRCSGSARRPVSMIAADRRLWVPAASGSLLVVRLGLA